GFRLMSRSLATDLLTAVSWRRYETEAELLAKAVSLGYRVDTVEISTIYFDRNRGTHFDPLWDSLRVVAVLGRCALSSLAASIIDIVAFAVLLPYCLGDVVRANVFARAIAIVVHSAVSRGDIVRTRGRVSLSGIARYGAIAVANLALTTVLILFFQRRGLSPVPAKILAQLTGVLVTFVVIETMSAAVSYQHHRARKADDPGRPHPPSRQDRAYARAASPAARDIDQKART
ncbi:MAG TPA: GtrA family protein, partial [Vicinamibacterales bacterium]|nr:GtrA family protein [Vicinamibacterales bacterium]